MQNGYHNFFIFFYFLLSELKIGGDNVNTISIKWLFSKLFKFVQKSSNYMENIWDSICKKS
jgi:hypothetical protein